MTKKLIMPKFLISKNKLLKKDWNLSQIKAGGVAPYLG
jgi:hypothetical protein